MSRSTTSRKLPRVTPFRADFSLNFFSMMSSPPPAARNSSSRTKNGTWNLSRRVSSRAFSDSPSSGVSRFTRLPSRIDWSRFIVSGTSAPMELDVYRACRDAVSSFHTAAGGKWTGGSSGYGTNDFSTCIIVSR